MKTPIKLIFLAFVASIMLVPGIAQMPPLDRDESRYIQATKQMVESGNYVDIRLQDVPRYKKPIGIYWLQSAAVSLNPSSETAGVWNYRLVSTIAGVASVLLVYWIGTMFFGTNVGLLSGLMFAGLMALNMEARIAKTDTVLIALALLAQGALAKLYLARQPTAPKAGFGYDRLFWVAQGLAILIKGPVVPMLSGLTIAALAITRRDRRWLTDLRSGTGILITILIAAPWLVLITANAGLEFWQESLMKDLFGKVATGQESHGFPPGYYFLLSVLFLWPFGHLVVQSLSSAGKRAIRSKRLLFLVCWFVPFWIAYELIPTKLPHYVYPAYPAVIILAAWGLVRGARIAADAPLWLRILGMLSQAGVLLVSLIVAVGAIGAPIYVNGQIDFWGVLLAIFALVTGWLGSGYKVSLAPLKRVCAATASAGVTYALAYGIVAPSLTPAWISPQIADAFYAAKPCDNSILATSGYKEPSLVFLTATETKRTSVEGVAKHLISSPDCGVGVVADRDTERFTALLKEQGLSAEVIGFAEGINYSKGDQARFNLYKVVR